MELSEDGAEDGEAGEDGGRDEVVASHSDIKSAC